MAHALTADETVLTLTVDLETAAVILKALEVHRSLIIAEDGSWEDCRRIDDAHHKTYSAVSYLRFVTA